MKIIKDIFSEKKWLMAGSCFGGVLGALIVHLNEFFPMGIQQSLDLPMGIGLAVALGMVGGIMGGVAGSLVSGALFKEEIAVNLGESLGIGLINGFLVGTVCGLILGYVHRIWPEIITPATLFILIGIIGGAAFISYRAGRKKRD